MTDIDERKLDEVNGGSIFITEEEGKKAGLSLVNEENTPGSWGYLYNGGDYYWRGQKLTNGEANAIVHYTNTFGTQPKSLQEALDYVK